MTRVWPSVKLGDVLRHRKEFITIDDFARYKRPRVQLHAKGIVLRDELEGALIKTKKQQICRAGDFLVAEIDAKVGGFGLVPKELDGSIVSSHYFLFETDETKLSRRFLHWFIQTRNFREQVEAQGTTNYAAIRPSHVLGYELPLPPLVEQERVVVSLDEVAWQVQEAQRLKNAAAVERDALCRSILRTDGNSERIPMRELVVMRAPDVMVRPDETYQFAGVYSFGRGVFRGQAKLGMGFAYPRLTTLRAGDFTYPKLMAWEGALGVVPPECDGCVVSTEFPVFEVDASRVLPEVLDVYFRDPRVWPELAGASTGTNVRRRRLNPQDFLNYRMPLPSRSTQIRLREVITAMRPVHSLDQLVNEELEAFVPALLDKAFRGELQ